MENVYNALEKVISCIVESKDYKICISLKNQMSQNEEISTLIQTIKDTQKKYIRSNYDLKVKEELDTYEETLKNIPVYHIYNDSLERVNQMIDYVKESLNHYFEMLLNS